MKISSRKRSLLALEVKVPDRVPICPLLYVQFPSVALDIPLQDLASPLAKYPVWKAELETCKLFKMDAQVDGAYNIIHDKWPLPLFHMAADFLELSKDVKIKLEVVKKEKDRTWYKRTFVTPKGLLETECVVPIGDQVWEKTPIISNPEEDLEKIKCILDGKINLGGYEKVREVVGDDGIVKVMTQTPINFWLGYRDISGQKSIIELYTRPELVKLYLEAYMEFWLIPLIEECSDHQIDVMWLDGTYIGYVNNEMFRKFVLPDLSKAVKKASFPINLFLSGGPIYRFLEDLKEVGVTCIEGLESPPKGDIILSKAKERIGDKVCLKGNVDTVLLENESPSEVEKAVKECIDSAAHGGGYILSAVDQPTINTPLENMTAFVKAGKKYGKY